MVRYIEIPKPVHCPKWGIDICLLGKYYLSDDMDSSVGEFKSASCPIVENSKLPLHKHLLDRYHSFLISHYPHE